MNSKVTILLFVLSLLISEIGFAQANLLNARVPQDVGQLNEKQKNANDEDPLPYGYVDDRDILWSKTIWERIDVDERVNFPYYYPIDTLKLSSGRRSLFHTFVANLKSRNIIEVYEDDAFKVKLTYKEVLNNLKALKITPGGVDQLNEQLIEIKLNDAGGIDRNYIYSLRDQGLLNEDFIEEPEITAEEIVEYRIKGTWYFNKRLGELKYRLLGIAPVAYELAGDPPELMELFWIWFPDARKSLNTSKVFNEGNSSKPITFDAMLNSRRFSAFIYKEENVYEDREIEKYIQKDALRQLLESERIKNVILDYELDLWNN
ncbi:MAG: gliding motility protein GldN [Flavobacteriaceae bacterium]|nr:gliding motility protein GldN [Flavobacteriaceae bacterium]|tara:strand:+ start:820 stop:1773 length:954 start_codon:yes stop_codon:yes gene_type:complete